MSSPDQLSPSEGPTFVAPVLESAEPEQVDPDVLLTPLMAYKQEIIGEPLGEYLCRAYVDEGLTVDQISQRLGLSYSTAYSWVRSFGVPTRPGDRDEEAREARHARQREVLDERHDEIVARVHAGDSNERRSRATLEQYANVPGRLEQQRVFIEIAKEAGMKRLKERRDQAFGVAGERLKEMHYGGMTIVEIAEKTGYSRARVGEAMGEFEVENVTPTLGWLEHNARVRQILPYIWEHPESMSELTPRERETLERRHLMEGPEPSFEVIGQEMGGLSKERIRQLDDSAIKKLQSLAGTREDPQAEGI